MNNSVLTDADLAATVKPVRERTSKIAKTKQGTHIIACPGCGSNPIRSHPADEVLDVQLNWTRTCPSCLTKLCIVCYPVGEEKCLLPSCRR